MHLAHRKIYLFEAKDYFLQLSNCKICCAQQLTNSNKAELEIES